MALSITIRKPALQRLIATAALAVVALLSANHARAGVAAGASTFATPEDASQALYQAVARGNTATVATILGAAKGLVSSKDPVQDKLDRRRFIDKYRQMHRLVREADASAVLYIGAENWPFPIPLVSDQGTWHFDAERGMDEVLFRRVGENELSATQACHALVLAQKERRWAQRDPSMTALRNLPARSADRSVAFHGYVFRAIASREADGSPGAASAYVAYPADYGSTGVMTYVVDQDDVVYAKDLGADTAKIARRMKVAGPDATWQPEQ